MRGDSGRNVLQTNPKLMSVTIEEGVDPSTPSLQSLCAHLGIHLWLQFFTDIFAALRWHPQREQGSQVRKVQRALLH